MNFNKMMTFAIMIMLLIIATIVSLGMYANNKYSQAYEESIILDETAHSILNIDEELLMGGKEDLVIESVMSELETIMTYDDELAFKEVVAEKGQTVLCSFGCSEIMLISGEAKIYCEGDTGFIDVTSGKEYLDGVKIEENHLFVMPVPEKNGAIVTSDEATFLIRGGYAIKE